ncbi:MAG: GlxA family transcriptional regulator [Myxococcota bacterium]
MSNPAIRVVAYEQVELLDVTGPINVLTAAARLGGAYDVAIVADQPGPVTTAGGIALVASRAVSAITEPFDTLIVPGGIRASTVPDAIVAEPPRLARLARRVVGVCTGAMLLARVGLLTDRRATTHWAAYDALVASEGSCRVERGPIFVRDGNVWTSAGVTAGMDLALALVEEDHGAELALEVARWLVMYLRRPGGQRQFSAALAAQAVPQGPLADLVHWVHEHLEEDLSVPSLARRAAMSPRHFARVFAREVGTPPGAWVQHVRLEAAKRLLEGSPTPIKQIAARCGFSSSETFHRAFARAFGITPTAHRGRFTSSIGVLATPATSRAPQERLIESKASI